MLKFGLITTTELVNATLSRWNDGRVEIGGGSTAKRFDNQALNTLFNYGAAVRYTADSVAARLQELSLRGMSTAKVDASRCRLSS